MGFSWSSCVSQPTLLSICGESGLRDRHVLACDLPLPCSLFIAFAVATDDLMIFSDAGAGVTDRAARAVEVVMLARGIVKNPEKDVDDTLSTMCVGHYLTRDLILLILVSVLGAPWRSTWAMHTGLICSGDCNSASSIISMGFALVRWLETGPCSRFLRRCLVSYCWI